MARERKFSTEDLFQAAKEILLQQGYEGFTFSLLAERLNVSRSALYKYYENREELITDYMIFEMNQFLLDLKNLDSLIGFESQFDRLLEIIFKHSKVHQILGMTHQISSGINEKVRNNKKLLDKQHIDMYNRLQNFIKLGRDEHKLKPHIADGLILGFIFQSINIPNHFAISQTEWIRSIKEILSQGMFKNK